MVRLHECGSLVVEVGAWLNSISRKVGRARIGQPGKTGFWLNRGAWTSKARAERVVSKSLNAPIFFINNLIMEQFENIKLYNADCMDVMRTFKDKQFDLAIIDPPYGLEGRWKQGKTKRRKTQNSPKAT